MSYLEFVRTEVVGCEVTIKALNAITALRKMLFLVQERYNLELPMPADFKREYARLKLDHADLDFMEQEYMLAYRGREGDYGYRKRMNDVKKLRACYLDCEKNFKRIEERLDRRR